MHVVKSVAMAQLLVAWGASATIRNHQGLLPHEYLEKKKVDPEVLVMVGKGQKKEKTRK